MSGTASRFQGRFPFAPGLMVGQYPLPAPAQPTPPVPTGVSTVRPAPVMGVTPAAAAPTVQVGSIDPERQRVMDGAGGSAQGDYGGPGPSGIGSTGSVLGDIAGFGRAAAPGIAGLAGGPMGVMGLGFGAIASGLAAALGAPETAAGIARASGLPNVAPIGFDPNRAEGPGATVGNPVGIGAFGTPGLGEAPEGGYGTPGVSVKGDEFGAPVGGPVEADKPTGTTQDYGNADGGKGDTAGTGENNESSPGSTAGGDKFMRGGYTGPGHPSEPAGTVHKGEVVIPAAQVQRYGLDPLLMLARGQVAPSRLSALLSL